VRANLSILLARMVARGLKMRADFDDVVLLSLITAYVSRIRTEPICERCVRELKELCHLTPAPADVRFS